VIIELRCIITASFDISRHNGYRSVFDPIAEQHENLSIVTEEAGCDGGKARNAVDDIISRYGSDQVLAVASIDGTMAVGGAVSALDTRDMLHPKDDSRHIPISTIDGTVPELRALSEGKIDHVSVQPAVGEGIMTMRLLYRMMKSGESFIAEEDAESMSGDELWMPVQVASSDGFEGPWFKTSVYTIPGDVSPSNPKIWSNRLHKRENGSLPDYASEATASAN
jgi:ribose transport system substrate-binding protein